MRALLIAALGMAFCLFGCQSNPTEGQAEPPAEEIRATDIEQPNYGGKPKSAAMNICRCVNDLFDGMHPALMEMMNIIARDGNKAGEKFLQEFISTSTPEEQQKLLKAVNQSRQIGTEFEKRCVDPLFEQFPELKSDRAFEREMLANIRNADGCEIVYQLYQTGEQSSEAGSPTR